MKYLEPPFVRQLMEMKDGERAMQIRDGVMRAFFASEAAQIVASVLQSVEGNAIEACRTGTNMQFNAGRLAAVDQIRNALVALLPVDEKADAKRSWELPAMEPYLSYSEQPQPTGE